MTYGVKKVRGKALLAVPLLLSSKSRERLLVAVEATEIRHYIDLYKGSTFGG